MSTVRIGIIGAGAIAGSCINAVSKHDQAEIIAVHDLSAERMAALADEHSIDRRYATADELCADGDVDAVYIAVPNKFHAPLAVQALQAGKHVIIDKPFAMNLEEAQGVALAAADAGKIFTVGMNQRFRGESQTVRNLVADGVLGEVYHAKAYWNRRTGIPKLGTWFGNKELAGGGCLLDIGVHMLDLCLYCLGDFDVASVSGATYTKFGNRGLGEGGWGKSDKSDIPFTVDDFATALLKMKSGATISLDVTWACHQEEPNRNNVQLFGTEAGAICYPAKLFRYGDELRTGYDVVDDLKPKLSYAHCDRFHNFINAIRGEEELCAPVDQSLQVQKVLDAIYASCASGKEVVLA